jgi:hypothetical protein
MNPRRRKTLICSHVRFLKSFSFPENPDQRKFREKATTYW